MDTFNESITKRKSGWNPLANMFLGLCVFGIVVYYAIASPHINSTPVSIHISKNESLTEVSQDLENHHIIRHAYVSKFLIQFFGASNRIAIGDYQFQPGQSTVSVAWQIARSKHNVDQIRVTIKEGSTNIDIAQLLADSLPGFRKDLFLAQVQGKQGYLFPDTYFFFPMTTADEIVDALSSNFSRKTSSLQADISSSNKTKSDTMTMASIIEKEAEGKDDAGIISGILWKRIALGMPLQADAAPITYTQKGLPDQPINNPGLIAINAALHPVDSPYLFYLHDKTGMVHYASTFAQHKGNIAKYLK